MKLHLEQRNKQNAFFLHHVLNCVTILDRSNSVGGPYGVSLMFFLSRLCNYFYCCLCKVTIVVTTIKENEYFVRYYCSTTINTYVNARKKKPREKYWKS